jgi:ribosomal protein S27E
MTAKHEQTERVRCPSCSALIPVPVGRDHWHPAQAGWVRPTEPLTCSSCGTAIGAVRLEWLVTVPMRMKQLASWGAILCTKPGQLPTHEDLDQVEAMFTHLQAQRQAAAR